MPISNTEYADYYTNYVALSGDKPLLDSLDNSLEHIIEFINSVPESKYEFAYAEGKWTIKELLVHLIDAERVFQYRALRFARADKTNLAGFDENEYVPNSFANSRSIDSIMNEYKSVRHSTIELFKTFSGETLLNMGSANNSNMSVRALGRVIVGHQEHHINIIKERYLS